MKRNHLILLIISVFDVLVGLQEIISTDFIYKEMDPAVFVPGVIGIIAGIFACLAVYDRRKVKIAIYLSMAEIILSAIGLILAIIHKDGIIDLISEALELLIAIYVHHLLETLKEENEDH